MFFHLQISAGVVFVCMYYLSFNSCCLCRSACGCMCLNLNENLSVWSKNSFRKSKKRLGRQQLGPMLPWEQEASFGVVAYTDGMESFSALRSPGKWRAIHRSNAALVQPNEEFLEYLMAVIQHRWLACSSQLLRTHCPFSCFIISNFPQKGRLQGKELKCNLFVPFYS